MWSTAGNSVIFLKQLKELDCIICTVYISGPSLGNWRERKGAQGKGRLWEKDEIKTQLKKNVKRATQRKGKIEMRAIETRQWVERVVLKRRKRGYFLPTEWRRKKKHIQCMRESQESRGRAKKGWQRRQTGIRITDAWLHKGYKAIARSVGRETTNQLERKTKWRRERELKKCSRDKCEQEPTCGGLRTLRYEGAAVDKQWDIMVLFGNQMKKERKGTALMQLSL